MDYSCYIIHVKEGAEAQELSIIRQFKHMEISFEWILDYDVNDLDQGILDRYGYHGGKLHSAEISCVLKHITAWEKIVAGGSSGGCVFEDDVLINIKHFQSILNLAIKEFYATEYEVGHISLGDGDAMYVPWTVIKKNRLLYLAEQVRMTDSYWITRETARMRLDWLAEHGFYLPADHLINKIDNELGIPILWLTPTVVTQGSHTGQFDSQLQKGSQGGIITRIKWIFKRCRRQYLYPLFSMDPRILISPLRDDLNIVRRFELSDTSRKKQ